MYLVISEADDNHVPYVERHLDEPFTVLTTRDILDQKACSYELNNGNTIITRNGHQLKNVQSVWFRRLLIIRGSELPVAPGKQEYAQGALKYFGMLLFTQFPDALWVSDYFITDRADDKLLQLQTAAKIGLNVPHTLITTSTEKAKAFVRVHKHAIAKPNYSARFQQNDKDYVFFTSRIDTNTDFSGLHMAPAILQQAIEVKTELRITVVGDQVFAASIQEEPKTIPAHIRDWRLTHLVEDVIFHAFDLPQKLADQCITVVKELGLQFGAIDAIIDTHGKFWFLENNANGQWLFIEKATGLPIGKALAQLLMQGKSKSK
ncbi:MAG TPA: hypothetical protein VLH38_03230 [Patescibacteria group bacterium]|nr:hypothetical protein [Patescibacteria group bacterium]